MAVVHQLRPPTAPSTPSMATRVSLGSAWEKLAHVDLEPQTHPVVDFRPAIDSPGGADAWLGSLGLASTEARPRCGPCPSWLPQPGVGSAVIDKRNSRGAGAHIGMAQPARDGSLARCDTVDLPFRVTHISDLPQALPDRVKAGPHG